jgi:hypothetical protein
MAVPLDKTIITIRISRAADAEVQRLAARDDESRSNVLRRLIRRGLELERRTADATQS